jgi:hypothetical protein
VGQVVWVVGPLPLQVKGDPINLGLEEVVERNLLGKTALVLLLVVAVGRRVAALVAVGRRVVAVPKAVVGSIVVALGNTVAVGSRVVETLQRHGHPLCGVCLGTARSCGTQTTSCLWGTSSCRTSRKP